MNLKIFLSALVFCSLNTAAQNKAAKPLPFSGPFDTTIIAILPIGENANWFESSRSFQLTIDDFNVIDSLLKDAVEKNNNYEKDTSRQRWNRYIHLSQYKRQYVPFVANGERKVFINCFHSRVADRIEMMNRGGRGSKYFGFDWRKEVISADGGGRNYFSVFVNLMTKNFSAFWINAPI